MAAGRSSSRPGPGLGVRVIVQWEWQPLLRLLVALLLLLQGAEGLGVSQPEYWIVVNRIDPTHSMSNNVPLCLNPSINIHSKWGGKKGGSRKQDAAAASCAPHQPTPLSSPPSPSSSLPKSAQPQAYPEDWLVPLLPSPLAGPDDPTTLPPGPFSAARILSFTPRKGASRGGRSVGRSVGDNILCLDGPERQRC